MSLSLSHLSADVSAAAVRLVSPVEETPRRSAPAPTIDRDAEVSASLVSSGAPRAQDAGVGAAVAALGEANDNAAAEEAWARIDKLLHQMKQLTLGVSDHAAAPASTTRQAIAAYSANASDESRAG